LIEARPQAENGTVRPLLGPDQGATVTAKPTRVILKKGAPRSAPITFTSAWPGKTPFFVSEWEENPSDPVADAAFAATQNKTVTAAWKNPGYYVIDVFLVHPIPGSLIPDQADPSVAVQVVQVTFQDENGNDPNGMKVGITTGTDRSRMITAKVNPAEATSSVTVKVSKGSDKLSIKNISPGSGSITFQIEGIGSTGSGAQGDCTFEADVDGKPAATADVTVVIPKKLVSQSPGTVLQNQNALLNGTTSPAFQGIPGSQGVEVTTYLYPVTVKVADQFGDAIGDPKLYLGAPVSEKFVGKGTAAPINRTIGSNSTYVDPVGLTVWQNYPAPPPRVGFSDAAAAAFAARSKPAFPMPSASPPQSRIDQFQVLVDGFPLDRPIIRIMTLSGSNLILKTSP
jgi:hypothetical protein